MVAESWCAARVTSSISPNSSWYGGAASSTARAQTACAGSRGRRVVATAEPSAGAHGDERHCAVAALTARSSCWSAGPERVTVAAVGEKYGSTGWAQPPPLLGEGVKCRVSLERQPAATTLAGRRWCFAHGSRRSQLGDNFRAAIDVRRASARVLGHDVSSGWAQKRRRACAADVATAWVSEASLLSRD